VTETDVASERLNLPTGTVTFLLTDVAGSTRMWGAEPDDAMRAAIRRHYEILSRAVESHDGVRPQEQGEGDSIVAAFARPSDALAAATAAQQALAAESWATSEPLRVRMAVHTGEAHLRDDANYAGQAIIRTARLRNLCHGLQVLVSGATRDLVVDQCGDQYEFATLGVHQLRDLGRPEQIWQLVVPGLPTEFEPLVMAPSTPHSLPAPVSLFVGREGEMADVRGLVRSERLVTVTGAGGAGKTRLAREVGAAVLEEFPAGVWWVELAPLEAAGVEPAVRAGFGISESASLTLDEAVGRLVDGRNCLLVLNNCEHVAADVSAIVARLLSRAPSLHILATSRVMLDLPGETAWRIPPLALPIDDAEDNVEGSDAVALFVDRARRSRHNFGLTADNAPVVAEIVRRLDGIPLAIELAAARTRMLDPERILGGLDDAFRILRGGPTSVMARQQTIDASISWSYDLLSSNEQTLLRHLSVFVDGWTLDAAEAICSEPVGTSESGSNELDRYAVFDALDRLVDHSLVHTTDTPSGIRFNMLETIRQYATRVLEIDPVKAEAIRDRHSSYFVRWAISLGPQILDGFSEAPFDAVEDERSNLLVGTHRAIERGELAPAIDGLAALAPAIEVTNWAPMVPEMLMLLDRIEARVDPDHRWLVHHVRQRMLAFRGDPVGELDTLAAMESAARASEQPVGVGIARFMALSIMSYAGMDTLDEMADVVDQLEGVDRGWASFGRGYLAVNAAYHGRFSISDAALARRAEDASRPILRAASDLALAMRHFARGEALEALAAFDRALTSRFLPRSAENLALLGSARAGADLGRDLTDDIVRRLSHCYRVDGRQISGIVADGALAVHHMLADELDTAHRLVCRAMDGARSIGMTGVAWPVEGEALIAAGFDLELEGGATTGAGPAFASSNRLALAQLKLREDDITDALLLTHEALRSSTAEGAHRSTLLALESISRVLAAAGRHEDATRIRGACVAFRAEHALVPYPCMQRLFDQVADVSRLALGDDEYDSAFADGATLSIDAAAGYAARLRVSNRTATIGWDALTPTEARVAELVAEGMTNPQVGTELLMGAETVKTHLSRVFEKVGVANRKELIVAASRRAAERHR